MFQKKVNYKIPDYNTLKCPSLKDFKASSVYFADDANKTIFFRGIGSKNANILFLGSCPLEEDIETNYSDPALLKAPSSVMFARYCLNEGINLKNEYYTTVCKYVLPRSYKLKPKASDIFYCSSLLEEEIADIKPNIIVCLGKEAATYILKSNFKLSAIEESWIYSKEYKAMLYIIEDPIKAFYKPELLDKLVAELKVLAKHYSYLCAGKNFQEIETHYTLIENFQDLSNWIEENKKYNRKLFSVDCEWGGMNWHEGVLRSIQFAWAPGHAVFIHFHNDKLEWVFDKPKEVIFKLLADYFNNPDIKFVGHNISADYVWMHKHIGIHIYADEINRDIENGRCLLDSMYAIQTINEFADLKLEKLAAKYTDLGRYDIDLLLWKKANKDIKFNEDEGYGAVPIDILFPYGCKDVDTVIRIYPMLIKKLQEDNTYNFYYKIKLPFVTEGFASMMEEGIPFDNEYATKTRLTYLLCGEVMKKLFYKMIREEAYSFLINNLIKYNISTFDKLSIILSKLKSYKDEISLVKDIKPLVKSNLKYILPYIKHWINIYTFNIKSPEHKKIWLYDIKKLTPVKTTKPKEGNAIDWSRVLALPEKQQKEYTPAVDKDTLKVFSDNGDNLCQHLLELNAIEQITKNFLKGDEGGLQKFICSDGKLRSSFSLTETSRPKAFKPNILQIPRYVTKYITNAFKKVNNYFNVNQVDKDNLDLSQFKKEEFEALVTSIKQKYDITSVDINIYDMSAKGLRSCFRAPEGYYFCDADLKSAEVWALSYLGNDTNMINAIRGKDYQFALKPNPDPTKEPIPVRIAYVDSIVKFSDKAKDPSLLHDINDPELLRDENGELQHPPRDMHWELVEQEQFMDTPREKMMKDKELYRNGIGKTAGFGIPYGSGGPSLQRRIEITTGVKQPEGTGEKVIRAYKTTRSGCYAYIEYCKSLVTTQGYYQSITGNKRHFIVPDINSGLSERARQKIIADQQREAANFPLQELVAATLALAVPRYNRYARMHNLKSRIVCPLYDAIYTFSPGTEITESHKLIEKVLVEDIEWDTPGGKFHFGTDHETTKAWGTPLTKEEYKELKKYID